MTPSPEMAFLRPAGASLQTKVGRAINQLFLADEHEVLQASLGAAAFDDQARTSILAEARALVAAVRGQRKGVGGIEAFLQQYDLGSQEGVVLMCLAEALLRIPDGETADKLIADKISLGQWSEHLGAADSLFVNASTWGLMLTGSIVRPSVEDLKDPASFLRRLVARLGEPVVRTAFRQAMRIMGHQFVMGRDIAEAQKRGNSGNSARYRYTFDMLGESALTSRDAERYLKSYEAAITEVGKAVKRDQPMASRPSISVKLSALHPRYDYAHRDDVLSCLGADLHGLCRQAMAQGIALTIDAEEADRLEISLELLDGLLRQPDLAEWEGLGLAVQAYLKRATDVVRWLDRRSAESSRVINVRLVKGAYWDSEIKRAQERGLSNYPVFTRKQNTDLSYLACARLLFTANPKLRLQFATHNAHTVASIAHLAREHGRDFEFQRLHGMGEELFGEITDPKGRALPCRVYAPVGSHEDLLPYLVRRLLENGANTSFVNRIVDEDMSLEQVVQDPISEVERTGASAHPRIPLPPDLFGESRRNSAGVNLADGAVQAALAAACQAARVRPWLATPIVGGRPHPGRPRPVLNPARLSDQLGEVHEATVELVDEALALAVAAQPKWNRRPARSAPPSCAAPQIPWRPSRHASLRYVLPRPARPCRMPFQSCARRWTSCATTPSNARSCSVRRCHCPVRPARATACNCWVAACLSASARGIFRWRYLPARWLRHWPPATA